jgi:hypothetical protein
MAITLPQSSGALKLTRTANLPAASAYTVALWFYLPSFSGIFRALIWLYSSDYGNTTGAANLIEVLQTGGALNLSTTIAGNNNETNTAAPSGAFQVGWHYIVLKSNGTTISAQDFRPDGVLETVTQSYRAFTPANLTIGSAGFSNEQAGGFIAAIKCWNAHLTDDELRQERLSWRPIRTADLNFWVPALANGDTNSIIDYSGNGRNLSIVAGTASPTYGDGPPISWGSPVSITEATSFFDSFTATYYPVEDVTKQWTAANNTLINSNLMVRYVFDEADSGSAVTQINDSSGNNYHLTEINYNSGAMFWIQDSDVFKNRGISSSTTDSAQSIRRIITATNDPFYNNRTGTKFTIEAVVRVRAASPNFGRIVAVHNTGVTLSQLSLGLGSSTSPLQFVVAWANGATDNTFFNISDNTGNPVYVLHVVVDTTLATNNDRIKLYINGVPQTGSNYPTITQNSTLSATDTTSQFWFFNRQGTDGASSGTRSTNTDVYYCAFYANAFTQQQVIQNYDILALQNDSETSVTAGNNYTYVDENNSDFRNLVTATSSGLVDEYKLNFESTPNLAPASELKINYSLQGYRSNLTIGLYQGATLIHSSSVTPTTSWTQGLVSVPATSWANITDWTNLRVRLTSAT